MHLHHGHYPGHCAAATLISGSVAVAGWAYAGGRALLEGVSVTQVNSGVAALMAALGTLVVAGLHLYTLISNKRRELSRKDFDEQIERQRLLDAANKESLTGQLEDLKRQREEDRRRADEAAVDSKTNQERMRASLHEINNQLNLRTLENQALQDDLQAANLSLKETNQAFIAASKDLAEANRRNADLTREVSRLRAELARLDAKEEERAGRIEAKVDEALGKGDSGLMPAVKP